LAEQNLDALAQKVAELIINAKRLVVFTGAGISTESGIPDFRSPGGIWSRFDPDDFTYQKFVSDAGARRKQWQMLGEGLMTTLAEPNLAHYAITELYQMGRLDCVITQNVDNLHQKAGVPAEMVFELHGNLQRAVCLNCGRQYTFEQIKARLDGGEEIPDCEDCHGILKPTAVFFGEPLPAYMPVYALQSGARLVIINLSPTPMDGEASVLIRARAGEAMSKIVDKLKERIG
jgi:NAD-dependent deacetylase